MQRGGKMANLTVSKEDYSRKKGDRYPVKKPEDNDILKSKSAFDGQTCNRIDFIPKKGERYEITRPRSSDLLKVSDLTCHKCHVSPF